MAFCIRVGSDGKNPRWFFSGVLNGWPGLTCLELLKIEYKGTFPSWNEHWDSTEGEEPTYPCYNMQTVGIPKGTTKCEHNIITKYYYQNNNTQPFVCIN